MTTASPMTTRAPGPLDLIIEKQQGQWDYQQTASMSIAIIKRCHHEHSRQLPRRSWRWSTDIKCYYSGTWRRLKLLIWAEGPPIGLYGTAVVQGLSSPWARWHSGTRDGVDAKKRTLYRTSVQEQYPIQPNERVRWPQPARNSQPKSERNAQSSAP